MVYKCGVFNVTAEGLGPQVGEGLEPIRVTAHCADLMPGFEKAACNLCSDPACCPGHDIGTLRVFHGSSSAFSRRTVTRDRPGFILAATTCRGAAKAKSG